MGDAASGLDRGALADLVDGMVDLVVGFDDEGMIVWANGAFMDLLGWIPEDVVGDNVLDRLHPDDAALGFASFREFLDSDSAVSHLNTRMRLRHANGEWITIEVLVPGSRTTPPGVHVAVCRYSPDVNIQLGILDHLRAGNPTAEVIALLLDIGQGHRPEGRFVMSFTDDDDDDVVVVGDSVPPVLSGKDYGDEASPFQETARSLRPVTARTDKLPPDLQQAAQNAGLAGVCTQAVSDGSGREPAFVAAWASVGGPDPYVYQYSVELMAAGLDLVLAWRRHGRD